MHRLRSAALSLMMFLLSGVIAMAAPAGPQPVSPLGASRAVVTHEGGGFFPRQAGDRIRHHGRETFENYDPATGDLTATIEHTLDFPFSLFIEWTFVPPAPPVRTTDVTFSGTAGLCAWDPANQAVRCAPGTQRLVLTFGYRYRTEAQGNHFTHIFGHRSQTTTDFTWDIFYPGSMTFVGSELTPVLQEPGHAQWVEPGRDELVTTATFEAGGPEEPAGEVDPDKNLGQACGASNACDPSTGSALVQTCGIGNPCDPATGNKYQTEADYVNPDAGLSFTRHYNSQFAAGMGLGRGWTSPLHRRLEIDGDSLRVRRGGGSGEPFTRTATGWQGDADSDLAAGRNPGRFHADPAGRKRGAVRSGWPAAGGSRSHRPAHDLYLQRRRTPDPGDRSVRPCALFRL